MRSVVQCFTPSLPAPLSLAPLTHQRTCKTSYFNHQHQCLRSLLLSSFQMKKKLTVDYEHNIKLRKYLHDWDLQPFIDDSPFGITDYHPALKVGYFIYFTKVQSWDSIVAV